MSKYSVLVCSHVVFFDGKDVYGPGHAVCEVLHRKSIQYVYLQYSLYGDSNAQVIFSSKKNLVNKLPSLVSIPTPLRYLAEITCTIYFSYRERPRVIVAVDPLNFIGGIISRRLGFTKKCIFYTADYAEKRFDNQFLNFIYHSLDRHAIKNADDVWGTSSRISNLRLKQGVEVDRNHFVPNAPIYKKFIMYHKRKKKKYSMVLMANFTPAIDYKAILMSVKILKKQFPNINIGFIGGGGNQKQIEDLVKKLRLENNVIFHGFMAHDKALDVASTYEVGLAPYTRVWSWTRFGDSLKAREYLALGMAVIISNTVSTSDDIKESGSGFVMKINTKNLVQSIESLFNNNDELKKMQRNALVVAKKFDLEKIITKILINKYLT